MALLSSFLYSQAWPTLLFLVILTLLGLALIPLLRRPSFPKSAPPSLKHSLPLIGNLSFFTRRVPFLHEGFKASPTGHFSFNYGPHPIIALSGESGRQTIYNARGLDLGAGFTSLVGGGPDTSHMFDSDLINDSIILTTFKRLVAKDRLEANLECLVGDVSAFAEAIRQKAADANNPGVIDVFDDIFRLVYQLTHRTLGCNEIADDPVRLASTLKAYKNLDVGSATEIMFPWLPIPMKLRKMWAGYNLFSAISSLAKQRRAGEPQTDGMQMLIDRGDSDVIVTVFIIGVLFAGVVNTGVMASRMICYLIESPEWHARSMDEIELVLSKHRRSPRESPSDILSRLTVDDWETEFSNMDLCLKETIRLNFLTTSMRKNLSGQDIPIVGSSQVIPDKMFAIYTLDDVHFNPAIYSDPLTFDPSRYLPGREEDKRVEHGYVGWGTGLHPCPGMKLAKLEITITTVILMIHFELQLVDEAGKPRTGPAPAARRNVDIGNVPPKEKIYLKCSPML